MLIKSSTKAFLPVAPGWFRERTFGDWDSDRGAPALIGAGVPQPLEPRRARGEQIRRWPKRRLEGGQVRSRGPLVNSS